MKLVSCSGRLLGAASSDRKRGERRAQLRVSELPHLHRLSEISQPDAPKRHDVDTGSEAILTQIDHRVRQQHLPAVRCSHQPRRTVHGDPK
jgi:hypothetical protein